MSNQWKAKRFINHIKCWSAMQHNFSALYEKSNPAETVTNLISNLRKNKFKIGSAVILSDKIRLVWKRKMPPWKIMLPLHFFLFSLCYYVCGSVSTNYAPISNLLQSRMKRDDDYKVECHQSGTGIKIYKKSRSNCCNQ